MEPKALLRDIQGLDPSPWWPPAAGWWLVLAGVVLAVLLVWAGVHAWRYRHQKWRKDAQGHLRALLRGLPNRSPKEIAGELSELLRRIAMMRCGRRECAGLQGQDWLNWLTARDPQGFDWRDNGAVLVQLPYAPDNQGIAAEELRQLISAVEAWTHSDLATPRTIRPSLWQRIRSLLPYRDEQATQHV